MIIFLFVLKIVLSISTNTEVIHIVFFREMLDRPILNTMVYV